MEGVQSEVPSSKEIDGFEELQERHRQLLIDVGASVVDAAAAAERAEYEEEVETWRLIEARGCTGCHPLKRCDSVTCAAEGWRHARSAETDTDEHSFSDPADDSSYVGFTLSAALERIGQRNEAIAALDRGICRAPADGRLRLARAKLLFRSGRKEEALSDLEVLQDMWRRSLSCFAAERETTVGAAARRGMINANVAGTAWYLSGWVSVHADDHTAAYTRWAEGALLVPTDARLQRQRAKVACWGEGGDDSAPDAKLCFPASFSAPVTNNGVTYSTLFGAVAFGVPDTLHEPALALFSENQRRNAAFLTSVPMLQPDECAGVVAAVDAHVASALGGVWGTVRSSSVPTTDIAVEDVPTLVPWLRRLLVGRVFPFLRECFPRLADGTTLGDGGSRLRVHDAFIVRYDAGLGSVSLPEHNDTSALSVSIALNEGGGVDYGGGGIWVRALSDTPCGGVVYVPRGCAFAFAGPLRHGGHPISHGVRIILVLFLYIENYAYGPLLGHASVAKGVNTTTGDAPLRNATSFVVYRETAQLVQALHADE